MPEKIPNGFVIAETPDDKRRLNLLREGGYVIADGALWYSSGLGGDLKHVRDLPELASPQSGDVIRVELSDEVRIFLNDRELPHA